MKRIFLFLFVFISLKSIGQVYQIMPQYGYDVKRMNFDSTLQIPTVCGVPTLKTIQNLKKAAIAFDSCNNRFYQYNPSSFTWSYLGGGGGSQNLQSVTDIGASTTNNISVVSGQYTSTLSGFTLAFNDGVSDIVISPINNLGTHYFRLYDTSTTTSYDTLATLADVRSSSGGNYVPYTGATADVDLGTHILNAQSIGVKGTNGNGHIDLRHQASDATATGQTTAIFADSNGDLKWKNAGNYYTTLKTSTNTTDRIYTFPNATTTLLGSSDTSSLSNRINLKLNSSDTSTLSSRINLKVNISDTSTMLSKYLRKTDTATLSNRINLKLNISDTSSMLTNYAKKDTNCFYLISDANTSNTTATNTNLTFSIGANETYRIMIAGTCSKATTTTGLKIAIAAPTGCGLKSVIQGGQALVATALQNQILSSINTLSTNAFATGAGVEVPFRLEGVITNGANAGSITLQFATVTSNTATIYAGTVMQLIKVKGL